MNWTRTHLMLKRRARSSLGLQSPGIADWKTTAAMQPNMMPNAVNVCQHIVNEPGVWNLGPPCQESQGRHSSPLTLLGADSAAQIGTVALFGPIPKPQIVVS